MPSKKRKLSSKIHFLLTFFTIHVYFEYNFINLETSWPRIGAPIQTGEKTMGLFDKLREELTRTAQDMEVDTSKPWEKDRVGVDNFDLRNNILGAKDPDYASTSIGIFGGKRK